MSDIKSYATIWDSIEDIHKGVEHTEMRVTVAFLNKEGEGTSFSHSAYYPTEMIMNGPIPIGADPYSQANRLVYEAVKDQYRKIRGE